MEFLGWLSLWGVGHFISTQLHIIIGQDKTSKAGSSNLQIKGNRQCYSTTAAPLWSLHIAFLSVELETAAGSEATGKSTPDCNTKESYVTSLNLAKSLVLAASKWLYSARELPFSTALII